MARKVGYGSPPEHARWNKGQSGNPSGRPKRPKKIEEDVLAELGETITINEGGRSRKITKQRALIKGHTARGIKGDARSAKLILDLMARVAAVHWGEEAAIETTAAERKIVEDYLEEQVELRLAQRKESGK